MSERTMGEDSSETDVPEEAVADIMLRLDGLEELDIEEHPGRFSAVHDELRGLLSGQRAQRP